MAWTELKPSGRYSARYLDAAGKKRSAGTFETQPSALRAAQRAEKDAHLPEEEPTPDEDVPLAYYFYEEWLPQANLEAKTKQSYESAFRNHIESPLGTRNVTEITTKDVRALVKTHVDRPHLAHRIKAVLGSVFTSLVEDEVVATNPAHGIRMPRATKSEFTPLKPEEFKQIVEQLNEPQRLFAKFLVGSGLRFSEGAALHLSDFDPVTREIHVRRRVTRVTKKYAEDTLLIQDSTKSKRNRVVPLSEALAGEVSAFVALNNLTEILFPTEALWPVLAPVAGDRWSRDGRHYLHGTRYSYNGGCRCELCLRAVAYAKYKHRHKESPRPTYLRGDRWSKQWRKAVAASGLSWNPRTHDLRHAHATILVASGVDIYEVQRRLGHQSINTTAIYLHRVESMMSKAAEASDVFL